LRHVVDYRSGDEPAARKADEFAALDQERGQSFDDFRTMSQDFRGLRRRRRVQTPLTVERDQPLGKLTLRSREVAPARQSSFLARDLENPARDESRFHGFLPAGFRARKKPLKERAARHADSGSAGGDQRRELAGGARREARQRRLADVPVGTLP